jgi:hypothetical protein
MDPDDLKKKDPPKSKNQKRNENRRLRKEEGGGDEVSALADKVAAAKVGEAPVAAAAPEDPKEVLSKKVNVARKLFHFLASVLYCCQENVQENVPPGYDLMCVRI